MLDSFAANWIKFRYTGTNPGCHGYGTVGIRCVFWGEESSTFFFIDHVDLIMLIGDSKTAKSEPHSGLSNIAFKTDCCKKYLCHWIAGSC